MSKKSWSIGKVSRTDLTISIKDTFKISFKNSLHLTIISKSKIPVIQIKILGQNFQTAQEKFSTKPSSIKEGKTASSLNKQQTKTIENSTHLLRFY